MPSKLRRPGASVSGLRSRLPSGAPKFQPLPYPFPLNLLVAFSPPVSPLARGPPSTRQRPHEQHPLYPHGLPSPTSGGGPPAFVPRVLRFLALTLLVCLANFSGHYFPVLWSASARRRLLQGVTLEELRQSGSRRFVGGMRSWSAGAMPHLDGALVSEVPLSSSSPGVGLSKQSQSSSGGAAQVLTQQPLSRDSRGGEGGAESEQGRGAQGQEKIGEQGEAASGVAHNLPDANRSDLLGKSGAGSSRADLAQDTSSGSSRSGRRETRRRRRRRRRRSTLGLPGAAGASVPGVSPGPNAWWLGLMRQAQRRVPRESECRAVMPQLGEGEGEGDGSDDGGHAVEVGGVHVLHQRRLLGADPGEAGGGTGEGDAAAQAGGQSEGGRESKSESGSAKEGEGGESAEGGEEGEEEGDGEEEDGEETQRGYLSFQTLYR